MVKIKFHDVMKALSLLFVFLLCFPVVTLVTLLLLDTDRTVFWEQLQFTLWGYWGVLSGWILQKIEAKRQRGLQKIVSAVLVLGMGILPVAGGILLHRTESSQCMTWMAILAFGGYLLGNRFFFRPYGKLVTMTNLVIGIAGDFACLWLIQLFQVQIFTGKPFYFDATPTNFQYTPLLYVVLVWIGLFAVLRNQANIDLMMNRRKHRMEDLPKKIRYYNLLLIVGVFVMIVLLFCLRGWIVEGLYWFLRRVRDLIALVLWGIYLFFRLIAGDGPDVENPESPKKQPQIATSGGESYAGIFAVILLIVLMGAVIYFRKQIFGWMSERLQRLFGWMRKWFGRSRLFEEFRQGSEYYVDEIESVRGQETIEQKQAGFTLKDWRKQYKKYSKMENSTDKLQKGYNLLANWLALKGVAICNSDTAQEILRKGEVYLKALPGAPMTEGYQLFKYRDEDVSDQTINQLDEILRKMNAG